MAKPVRQLPQGPLYVRLAGTRRYYLAGKSPLVTYSREHVEKFKRGMDPGTRWVYDERIKKRQAADRGRVASDVTVYMNKYPNRFKSRTEVRRDSDFKQLSHLMRRIEAERSQHHYRYRKGFYEPIPEQDPFFDLDGPYAQALIALGYRDPDSLIPPGKSPRKIQGVHEKPEFDEETTEEMERIEEEEGVYYEEDEWDFPTEYEEYVETDYEE